MSGPLSGIGILITRPARQAAALASEIAAVGGAPVVFPTIVILPPTDRAALDRAQQRLDYYDYAIFVSANAVEYGVGDATRWPRHLVAFAPGPGTAAALASVGISNVRIPSTSMDSEGLLALPEFIAVADKRVLIFRGGGGREVLGDTLAERGAEVDYVDCYRRVKPEQRVGGLLAAWREGRIDAVTLTSTEGLDNLWAVLGDEGRAKLTQTPTFVPHPRIAERARALGLREVIVSAPADSGLVAALLEYFAHPRPST